MVTASGEGVVLAGEAVSVSLGVAESERLTVDDALQVRPEGRIYLSIDDLRADSNPGVVYGVYLDLPPDAPAEARHGYHVGNIAPFGIEHANDPDTGHEGDSGFRHVFDITDRVRALQHTGVWDPTSFTVTFEVITPLPPPGKEEMRAQLTQDHRDAGAAEPLHVGRVSLFVG
jgi:tyrosinase